jgi:dTDP-glucose pyrophosphorylase
MQRQELKRFIVAKSQTVRQAMEAINENWREIVFVEDEQGKLVGTITDGDIRRGLLSGLSFDASVELIMNKSFTYVSPEIDRVRALETMKARGVLQIPIVDSGMRLVGIHFLQELLGTSIRPNAAVVMAGGKGVRLRPVTETIPKPMVCVAGRPILERIILHLMGFGIRRIYVALNYMGELIEEHFGDGSHLGCELHYLKESTCLGTGGALSLIPEDESHPLVVMNGDLVTQVNIGNMLEFHEAEKCVATVGVSIYPLHIPFGVVKKSGNRLVEMHEKPVEHFLINTGIYILDPSTLRLVPKNEEFPITSLIQSLLQKDMSVGTFLIEEEWIDIGRHADLRKANGIIDE